MTISYCPDVEQITHLVCYSFLALCIAHRFVETETLHYIIPIPGLLVNSRAFLHANGLGKTASPRGLYSSTGSHGAQKPPNRFILPTERLCQI
ncbi:hypothetical protein Cob_v001538 [Colletotrichum orbiculare MAFF 240422]|uniref:Uncharacterized protein n=1 Tax=Colletotrichum orbiculare (strain 104-T / ATCC 96160 / CBS 514.97 / LARS 414 / MAFF 240422) TaxID=1213857 RepID=A0A484G6I1_COLOR|nr:hypothetical protein Cob_v001538 [Colletotrichum orbiculare MAFF 240422]